MGFKHKPALRRRNVLITLGLAGSLAAGLYLWSPGFAKTADRPAASQARGDGPGRGAGRSGPPQAVHATIARSGDLDVVLAALGTVTASNTATVKPRVSGQLLKVHFREGQEVAEGELLAEIDPRPFQIRLDRVRAQRLKDEAILGAARVDLERYRALLAQDSIARQQVETQEALVRQYEATVEADKAEEEDARLQLGFTRVTAPAAGRVGLRLVDAGNLVNAQDAGGLAAITRTQPIHAVFAVPADDLAPLLPRLQGRHELAVEAWSRDGATRLASGRLLSVDNQIDVSTGTLKLKAEFANRDNLLFPNQFINVRLKAETRRDAVLLQAAAVLRNAEGSFVYVVADDDTVSPRPVVLGPAQGDLVVVERGLTAGEKVVLDGTDRLRPGARVAVLSLDGLALAAADGHAGAHPLPVGAQAPRVPDGASSGPRR